MSTLQIRFVTYAEAESALKAVRTAVFQDEQGVAPELEFDGLDQTAKHVLAWWDGQPVGTARWRSLSPTPGQPQVKIERVAVLKAHRGQGWGRQIMLALLDRLGDEGVTHIKIHAQTPVQAFYERLGFTVTSAVFVEADIPHVVMEYHKL